MTEDRLVEMLCKLRAEEEAGQRPAQVESWAAQSPAHAAVVELAEDEQKMETELQIYGRPDPDAAFARWQAGRLEGRVRSIRIVKRAAMLILAMVGAGMLVGKFRKHPEKTNVVASFPVILPGRNTATLSLANGRTILLDTIATGELALEGNTQVMKTDTAGIAYSPGGKGSESILLDTLTTPRCGQYRLRLPDGSRVWLNNASQLQYPASFEGQNRLVELTGEAYFEIAGDPGRPFLVSVNGRRDTIQALGTAFDIMAFPDEDATRTTLITGGVKVTTETHFRILKPGEQARVDSAGGISVVSDVSADDIASWKDGIFYFHETPLREVMRQLSRWYAIRIKYDTDPGETAFSGTIKRNLPLDSNTVNLFSTKKIRCRLEGRQLIVEAN